MKFCYTNLRSVFGPLPFCEIFNTSASFVFKTFFILKDLDEKSLVKLLPTQRHVKCDKGPQVDTRIVFIIN